MTQALDTERIERIEREIEDIKTQLEGLAPKRWVTPQKAALHFETSPEALIRKIKSAMVFPEKSLYKEGIHWRMERSAPVDPTKEGRTRYKINLSEWGKV